jgi:hypothetical protein
VTPKADSYLLLSDFIGRESENEQEPEGTAQSAGPHPRNPASEDRWGETIDAEKKRWQGTGQAYIKLHRQVYYIDADRPRYLGSLKVDPPRSKRATAAPTAFRKPTRHHEETTNP